MRQIGGGSGRNGVLEVHRGGNDLTQGPRLFYRRPVTLRGFPVDVLLDSNRCLRQQRIDLLRGNFEEAGEGLFDLVGIATGNQVTGQHYGTVVIH